MSYATKKAPASTLVLTNHPQKGWILIHRNRREMVSLTTEEAKTVPTESVIVRPSSKRFLTASLEVTELCNVRCVHCYLGERRRTWHMDSAAWFAAIDRIDSEGVIWLQFTGGEPLTFAPLADIYAYAWDRGFVTSVLTNGIRLGEPRFLRLFSERPPFRLSISVYGASKASYEAITRVRGSWERFSESLKAAHAIGLPLRLKVVELVENKHEVSAMRALARRFGEEDVVREIMPTLQGDCRPLEHRVRPYGCVPRWNGCEAGMNVFHVLPNGRATICKVVREPSVPLKDLERLSGVAEKILQEPTVCSSCGLRERCGICPPLFQLLNSADPNRCRKEVMS